MGAGGSKPVVITDEVQLNHFKLLRVVGKGAFGKVRIVERKDTGLTFALKYIRKDEVVRSENVRNIIKERRMLEHLDHNFLCNLRYSFQDYEYLYLVVDLMNGGDLRFHITRKTFTEEAVRFWIAELGCALRYIHSQGIVHRDVKPDNVLLDSEGHVHLADFNVASELKRNKPLTSKSGTLAYLAPEVYQGKGYGSQVDWWSLGVVLYECIFNKRPFIAQSQQELAAKIKEADPHYPFTDPPVSTQCVSAMQRLLEVRVPERIGANGFQNFTNHPFFLPIDFPALERKEIRPIFVPSSVKTNFDATYDLEELLLEEAPLEARAKHQKPRAEPKPGASAAEMRAADLHRMIEQYFEPFNYMQASLEKMQLAAPSPRTKKRGPSQALSDSECTRTPSRDPSPPEHASEGEGSLLKPPNRPAAPPRTFTGSTNVTSPEGSPPLPSLSLAATAASSPEDLPPLPSPKKNVNKPLPPISKSSRSQTTPHRSASTTLPKPKRGSTSKAIDLNKNKTATLSSAAAHDLLQAAQATLPADSKRKDSLTLINSTQSAMSADVGHAYYERKKAQQQASGKHSGTIMGFLSRNKKTRDRSPVSNPPPENGVLGKDGARVVVDHTAGTGKGKMWSGKSR